MGNYNSRFVWLSKEEEGILTLWIFYAVFYPQRKYQEACLNGIMKS